MNVLAIYGFLFIITFIILGLKFEFKNVSFLKSMGITFAIVIILLVSGILPTHIGKAGEDAFYIYNVHKSARIFGKGDINVNVPQSVKKVIINNGIETIVSCKQYDNLKFVKIADSVNKIGEYAFVGCKSLEEIELPDNVTIIEKGVFNGCESLKNIKLPKNLDEIDDAAFYNCKSLEEIELPAKVRIIGNYAFSGCEKLGNIELPENIKYIGIWAFMDTNITEISIPDSALLYRTFYGAKRLKKVNIGDNNENYVDIDGVIFNKDKTEIVCYPSARENDTYAIPDTVEFLNVNTFGFCDNLKKLIISESINSIGNHSIHSCKNLESIEIMNGVEKIENEAIYDCKKLSKIYIPESVTEISNKFYYTGAGYEEKVENPTIYCSAGSSAEEYAKENNYSYIINQ